MTQPHQTAQELLDRILESIDFEALPAPGDKICECEFFLNLASAETDRTRFRWLVGAYLNAVYSYFETTALSLSVRFTDPKTGESCSDVDALNILKDYVSVSRNGSRINARGDPFVKTESKHCTIVEAYKHRNSATHRRPLSIMVAGPSLPEDFHAGYLKGEGVPLLALCRDVLALVKEVQAKLDALDA